MKKFLNSMIPLLKHSQDRLCDLWKVSNYDEFQVYEWTFLDAIKCKGPVLQKEIDGLVVKYNSATKQIFLEDLVEKTVETICSIYNSIKWGG